MEKLKLVFQHTLMISFGICVAMGVQCVLGQIIDGHVTVEWFYPISIPLTGLVCSIPSVLLAQQKQEQPARVYARRIALHCISLYVIVIGFGRLFKWYTVLSGFIILTVEFFLIYIFVWAASGWIGLLDAKEINEAIESIRDEE